MDTKDTKSLCEMGSGIQEMVKIELVDDVHVHV